MKKLFFIGAILFSYNFCSAQLISGSLLDEGRKMTSKFDFNIEGKYSGHQFFELSVNSLGEVTSVKHLEEQGGLISTPAKLIALKELYNLKFDGATYYPKFQHVKVKVNYTKK
jgi:hypothetical protein